MRLPNRILVTAVFAVLLAPAVATVVPRIAPGLREPPLGGAWVVPPRPDLTVRSWFDGSFAAGFEAWHDRTFGLRPTLVRLYNQEGYWLFGVARANRIVIGERGTLYDLDSIRAARGESALGPVEFDRLAQRISEVERALAARGVTLVVGIAPGKPTIVPEDLPDAFGPPVPWTPGRALARALARRGDFVIDWIDLFEERRRDAPWPLFPKTGMHWSRYAAALAVDDLVAHVERRRQVDLPGFVWRGVRPAAVPRDPDDDVGQAMNLLFPIDPGITGEPDLVAEPTFGKVRPSLLVIGDSFAWTMFAFPIAPGIFSRVDFRFYNRERHRFGEVAEVPNDPVAAVLAHDVVLLLVGEGNADRAGWGWVEAAHAALVAPEGEAGRGR